MSLYKKEEKADDGSRLYTEKELLKIYNRCKRNGNKTTEEGITVKKWKRYKLFIYEQMDVLCEGQSNHRLKIFLK